MTTQEGLFAANEPLYAGAEFDPTRAYRYRLWRRWSDGGKPVLWIMLNPSTANESDPDPTLTRCLSFSKAWGYSALEIVNLYAYVTPYPKQLFKIADPVGPENLKHIEAAVRRADRVIAAWGASAPAAGVAPVVDLLKRHGVSLYCVRRTMEGHPCHPVRLPKHLKPISWSPPA